MRYQPCRGLWRLLYMCSKLHLVCTAWLEEEALNSGILIQFVWSLTFLQLLWATPKPSQTQFSFNCESCCFPDSGSPDHSSVSLSNRDPTSVLGVTLPFKEEGRQTWIWRQKDLTEILKPLGQIMKLNWRRMDLQKCSLCSQPFLDVWSFINPHPITQYRTKVVLVQSALVEGLCFKCKMKFWGWSSDSFAGFTSCISLL